MVQNVEMLKQKFDIKGRYLKAPDSRIYLKLTVSGLPDSNGTMLQVCDGETLWEYQQILESQIYRKLSASSRSSSVSTRPTSTPRLATRFINQMGFAGPDALLVGLRKSVRFDQKEKEEVILDGKRVGSPRHLEESQRTGRARPAPGTRDRPVAGLLPSLATLYLGKDDGWPYRMDLVGKVPTILQDTRRVGPDGRSSAPEARSRRSMPARSSSSTRTSSSTRQYAPRSSRSRRPPTRTSRTTPSCSSRASTRPSRLRQCKNEPRPPTRKDPSSTSPSISPSLPPIRHPSRPREPDFRTHVPGGRCVDSRRART